MDIVHTDYLPDREKVGRLVPNAFGCDEIVTLSVRHWKHFDWLSAKGINMALWTKEADICRHRIGYRCDWDSALAQMLQNDENRRHFTNLECPLFIRGEIFTEPSISVPENVRITERLATDNEPIEREYQGPIGIDIQISMRGKYWRYLDWLCEIGGDHLAQEWVTFAGFERSNSKVSLGEYLEELLLQHEENMYIDYEGDASLEMPLYICPIGYLNLRPIGMSTRELMDSTGSLVPIRLSAKSWEQHDWLENIGVDMKKFVIETDKNRIETKAPRKLFVELVFAIQREYENRLDELDRNKPALH